MACLICLGVVNSCCGELKYANFSEINSNYSLPPVSFPPFTARVCVIWNLTIAYGPLIVDFGVSIKDYVVSELPSQVP